ncbi:MAG: DUF6931 family protein [Gemmataceae bacterium]
MNDPLKQPVPAVLLKKGGLEPDERAGLRPDANAAQAADALAAAGHAGAALKVLAWALPRREAVWWAVECVAAHADADAAPEEAAALAAARQWAAAPSEDRRRAAEAAAADVNYATPAGQAAIAACWSGGSLAPPKLAVVPPPEHLLPRACANAALLAVTEGDPATAAARLARCVALAAEVASGKNRWKEEKATVKR